jgi:tetratricopeptide (TPR) repeat protein
VHHLNDNNEQALADCGEALRLDPENVAALRARGWVLLSVKRYQEAIADLTRATELAPGAATPRRNRGSAYLGLRQYAQAEADLSLAIKLDPRNSDSFFLRSIARAAQQRWADSAQDFAECARLSTGSGWRSQVWFVESITALLAGEGGRHRQLCDKLVSWAGATGDHLDYILAARACLLQENGTIELARVEQLAQAGLKAMPDYGFYLNIQGRALLAAGKTDAALSCLEKAQTGGNWNSPVLNHLALCLAWGKKGDWSRARSALEQAEQLGVPLNHPHDTLEYQLLLARAKRMLAAAKPTS